MLQRQNSKPFATNFQLGHVVHKLPKKRGESTHKWHLKLGVGRQRTHSLSRCSVSKQPATRLSPHIVSHVGMTEKMM